MSLPDAAPEALLEAFLSAHASRESLPLVLFTRGEELHRRLADQPPGIPAWGRFLVALGSLAANDLDDHAAASRYFLAALTGVATHGDHEAAVAAGFNQGVLQEKRGAKDHALAAYRAAAKEGFRLGVLSPVTLRSAVRAAYLHFDRDDRINEEQAQLAKQSWLAWFWLRRHQPAALDGELRSHLGRQLCGLLLPEDDPGALAEEWRLWPPHQIPVPGGVWTDGDPLCLRELFAAAAEAADEHLRDEGPDPAAPYRLLLAAAIAAGSQD